MKKNLTAIILIVSAFALLIVYVIRDIQSTCFEVQKIWESVLNNRDGKFEVHEKWGSEIWTEKRTPIPCEK